MIMRNHYDGPEPTPDEQLRASGRRSLVGLFVVNLLALVGIACALMGDANAATVSDDSVTIQLKRGSTIVALVPAPSTLADCEQRKAGLIAIAAETKFSGTATYSCIETRRSVVTFSANPPPPPPVDCVVSDWGDWVLGTPSACVAGSQTRTDTHTRTVTTPAANGGAACPALSETRTTTLTCAVEPPPPAPIPAVGTITATSVLSPTNPPNYNVTLSWVAVAGATGYVIERCVGSTCASNFLALGTTSATTYTNSNVPGATTYRYRIRGTAGAVVGAWSALHNVTTPTAPPPVASTIRINSGGPAVADYLADVHFVGGSVSSSCNRTLPGVYATRRFSSTGFEYRIPVVNGSYVVRLLWQECWHTTAGQRVLSASVEGQAIAAFDTWGTSGAVITHERTVSVADGVLNIALTAGTGDAMVNAIEVSKAGTQPPPPPPPAGEAKISWVPPTTNIDGSALTNLASYNLFWSSIASPNPTKIVIANPAQTQYTMTGLAPGGYSFMIQACNSAGTCGVVTNAATRVVQ